MKMEIQKKIWTSRYEKRGVNCGFCTYMHIDSMRKSRNFYRGVIIREGGLGPTARKQPGQLFFQSSTYFTVYRRGSNGFITEKTILIQGSRGGPTFSRGSSFFQGVQMLISIDPN